jgi:predicted aspartyl protease
MRVITIETDKSCIAHEVSVAQSLDFCERHNLERKEKTVIALWDTGSGDTGISKSLAKELGLARVKNGKSHEVKMGAGGPFISNFHLIDILLSHGLQISNVKVSDYEDNGQFDIVIGMDIITMGDFAITGDNGKTVFSFVIPSRNKPIDFGSIPTN